MDGFIENRGRQQQAESLIQLCKFAMTRSGMTVFLLRVLLVLCLRQSEAEQTAVGINLMAPKAGELVHGSLRNAVAGFRWRLLGGDVAGGLHAIPEPHDGAVGLRKRWMGG
jgi:hypothetical protein